MTREDLYCRDRASNVISLHLGISKFLDSYPNRWGYNRIFYDNSHHLLLYILCRKKSCMYLYLKGVWKQMYKKMYLRAVDLPLKMILLSHLSLTHFLNNH